MIANRLGEEEITIMRMSQEELSNEEIRQPMNLRFENRKTMKEKKQHYNKILKAALDVRLSDW